MLEIHVSYLFDYAVWKEHGITGKIKNNKYEGEKANSTPKAYFFDDVLP